MSTENDYIQKIIELAGNTLIAVKNVNDRVNSIENKIVEMSHIVNGNGKEGLAEACRNLNRSIENLNKEIIEIKVFLDDNEETFDEFKQDIHTKIDENAKQIKDLKSKNKFIFGIVASIATFLGSLIGLAANYIFKFMSGG